MTIYEKELTKIRSTVYANQTHINTVVEVRNFIKNNYDLNINLEVLSNVQFVSKFHLLRLFKKYYGLTPRQYLINKRIEKSKEHLKNGMTVTETCFAVGFESVGSFSTLYKTKTGTSPSVFKKSNFREAQ